MNRMDESSTYRSGPMPTYYGLDYMGAIPPGGSVRSERSELAVTRPGIATGTALIAAGIGVLGISWLIYTTRER